jgi:Phage capsid protein
MPDIITTAFVQDYKSTIDLLLQQSGSRFRMAVTEDGYTGKQGAPVEQFGPAVAQKKTGRHAPSPVMNLPQDRRWVFPYDYEWGSLIDDQDKLRMIIDPTSAYAVNGANAMARAMDDEIIGSFFATSYVGENGTSTETFDTATYQVGVNTGGTASSLNVAKLQSALQKLMLANKGEIQEQAYCAISSYEHDALLKEIQVVNKDYNGGAAVLQDGVVRKFMGFNFIITERLAISSGNRLIPCWVKSGMHMGSWQDIKTEIARRADLSFSNYIYLCGTFGATRLQQGKVVQVLCDDQI